jgi:hypothetical protein
MIKYEYLADILYEAGLKPGYIVDYLSLSPKDSKILSPRDKEKKERKEKKPSFYKKLISCVDLSDPRIKEFSEIVKSRKIDYNKWDELHKKFDITENGIIPFLIDQRYYSENSDFFAAKKYIDDVCKDEKLKLSSNDAYFLYGKFLKKIYVSPREDIEFLLNEGVSYYKIEKLFNQPLSGVNGRDLGSMTKTYKRIKAKPHKKKANEENIKKIIIESEMNANIKNAVRLVKFFRKRDADHIVQVLMDNSVDCPSTEVEKKITIPLEMLFKKGFCVLDKNI